MYYRLHNFLFVKRIDLSDNCMFVKLLIGLEFNYWFQCNFLTSGIH